MLRPVFRVTLNQSDIRRYQLPKQPGKIEYSLDFEEHEARIHVGLSLKEYDDLPGTMDWCDVHNPISKSEVIALYRLHYHMRAVQEHLSTKKKR